MKYGRRRIHNLDLTFSLNGLSLRHPADVGLFLGTIDSLVTPVRPRN